MTELFYILFCESPFEANKVEEDFEGQYISAGQKNGELIIIELGDGQVAGLPDRTERTEFYKQLKICCC